MTTEQQMEVCCSLFGSDSFHRLSEWTDNTLAGRVSSHFQERFRTQPTEFKALMVCVLPFDTFVSLVNKLR